MQEFHHVVWDGDENSEKKISNCHDTYVNLVNDKLAAIKFSSLEDFTLIPDELKSLAGRLRNLVENLSKVNSNTEKLQEFIKNTSYKTPAINDLATLIDSDMGYVYPEHLKDFITIILQQRITAYRASIAEKFSTAESRAEELKSAVKAQPIKPALVFKKNSKSLIKKKICAKYDINECTLKPEFDLILKIVRAMNSIENGHPSDELIEEIYNTVGLYKNYLIPDAPLKDLDDKFYKENDKIFLENLQALLNGSFFTIEKFLSLDIQSRWHITSYHSSIFGDDTKAGIDVLNAKTDALQIYITCQWLLMQVRRGIQPFAACVAVFEKLGIDPQLEGTGESLAEQLAANLQTICDIIANIIVPFDIDLSLYRSFNQHSIITAQTNTYLFIKLVNRLQACPIKLLQLNPEALIELLFNPEIRTKCDLSGISVAELTALPKEEIEMIFGNEQYIHRLPVLTRAYFLPAQQFLNASLEQKQVWLDKPSATKLWFDGQNMFLGPNEFKEAITIIETHTKPILNKLAATEALLYLKDLLLSPWDIVTMLQKQGFKYSQCRAIFKLIKFINEHFKSTFVTRFTEEATELFDEDYLLNTTAIQLRFGEENAPTVIQALRNYINSLKVVLGATSHDSLPPEFNNIITSNDQNELINNMSKTLCLSNTFCKHLRLYKKTQHEALLELFDISVPQIRTRYYDGEAKIFEMLCDDPLNYVAINIELDNNPYHIRNTQEFSMFAYAIESNDLQLINLTSSAIKGNSKKDIQQFLKENRFPNPPAPKGTLLFNDTSNLSSRLVNAVHPDTGDTPLLAAIRQNNTNIALALIMWGANLDAKDSKGLTPGTLATKLDIVPTLHDIYFKCEHNKILADNLELVNSAKSTVRL